MFQSYLSPIQTQSKTMRKPRRRLSFNPILVQFKRRTGQRYDGSERWFQSYLSPIQTGRTAQQQLEAIMFQSYLSPNQTAEKAEPIERNDRVTNIK